MCDRHSSPREINGPATNKVPSKGARVKVEWSGTGQGRGEGDVDEESHQPCGGEP